MSVHIESAGRGAPLVLLHGWAMHSALWAPLLPRLIGRFRVHLVDLPGHGHSPPLGPQTPYTLDAIVAAIAAGLGELPQFSTEPPTLLGWSLGGMVALKWALAAPQRLTPVRLVLTATTPCFVQRPDWPHAMPLDTLQQFGDELRLSYKLTLQRFVTLQVQGSDDARAVLSRLREQLFGRGEPAPQVLRDALDLLATTDLRGEVAAIAQPTLVIAGDRDMLTPAEAGKWLADAIPRATYRLIPGAAHAPFLSHPDAFVAALAAFTDGP